jgi:hypothetical protein
MYRVGNMEVIAEVKNLLFFYALCPKNNKILIIAAAQNKYKQAASPCWASFFKISKNSCESENKKCRTKSYILKGWKLSKSTERYLLAL